MIDMGKFSTEEKQEKGILQKIYFPLSVIIFSLSLFFYLITSYSASYKTSRGAGKNVEKAIGFHYKNPEEVGFVPSKVNNVVIDSEKIKSQAKQKYPSLKEENLKKVINQNLFSLLALEDFFPSDAAALSAVDNYQIIEDKNQIRLTDYNKNLVKLDGFYIKVRFSGTSPGNIQKLGKSESQLKSLAEEIITGYKEKAVTYYNPASIVDEINSDETVKLLNNGELSRTFTDYELYPPFFDDSDFYPTITSLPLNEFSKLITLKTINPQEINEQDYAYIYYYLSKKTGENLPIAELIRKFIIKSSIR